jgi:hypothetical protein
LRRNHTSQNQSPWLHAAKRAEKSSKKTIPETDAIFNQLEKMHKEAEEDETILRVSLDAKATVLIGLFSRRGKTRVIVRAADHDFKPVLSLEKSCRPLSRKVVPLLTSGRNLLSLSEITDFWQGEQLWQDEGKLPTLPSESKSASGGKQVKRIRRLLWR